MAGVKGRSGRKPTRAYLAPGLRRLLRERRPDNPDDPYGGMTNREALVRATLELALSGDPVALRLVWERVDGRLPEQVELTGARGGPLQVVFEVIDDRRDDEP